MKDVMTLGLPANAMMAKWSSGRAFMRFTANVTPLLSLLGWTSSDSMDSDVSMAMSMLRDCILFLVTDVPW